MTQLASRQFHARQTAQLHTALLCSPTPPCCTVWLRHSQSSRTCRHLTSNSPSSGLQLGIIKLDLQAWCFTHCPALQADSPSLHRVAKSASLKQDLQVRRRHAKTLDALMLGAERALGHRNSSGGLVLRPAGRGSWPVSVTCRHCLMWVCNTEVLQRLGGQHCLAHAAEQRFPVASVGAQSQAVCCLVQAGRPWRLQAPTA